MTKVNCSTSFILATRFPKIIWCGRPTLRLDLSWFRSELAPHYSSMGRPSIDPELMIRMLVVGYVFAIRSERLICREVQVNLAYRWFCKLGIEDAIPDHSAFSRARNERFREGEGIRRVFERVVETCIAAGLVGGEGFAVDAKITCLSTIEHVCTADKPKPRRQRHRSEMRGGWNCAAPNPCLMEFNDRSGSNSEILVRSTYSLLYLRSRTQLGHCGISETCRFCFKSRLRPMGARQLFG